MPSNCRALADRLLTLGNVAVRQVIQLACLMFAACPLLRMCRRAGAVIELAGVAERAMLARLMHAPVKWCCVSRGALGLEFCLW